MNDNPWASLSTPDTSDYFRTRRVSEDLCPCEHKLSWAKDCDGRVGLYIEYSSAQDRRRVSIPKFSHIEVREIADREKGCAIAVLLKNDVYKDTFYEICVDIIKAVQAIEPRRLRAATILRLQKWSCFLEKGGSGMDDRKQRGLIAELLFLDSIAIPAVGDENAIRGWTGPERQARDFSFGGKSIEVKSKKGSDNHFITISSSEQLETGEAEQLYLYVVEVRAPGKDKSVSVNLMVAKVKTSMESQFALCEFETKLARLGYFGPDSADGEWSLGTIYAYVVQQGFPRIESAQIPGGISHVKYSIDLNYCTEYLVDLDNLKIVIGEKQ